MSKEFTPAQTQIISEIKGRLRITKVVATRSVKTKAGDFFVGMSAAWDSTQEDAGMGTDLIGTMTEAEAASSARRGMTQAEARVAALILAREVDLQAQRQALGGGAISKAVHDANCQNIRTNYGLLLAEVTPKERKDI